MGKFFRMIYVIAISGSYTVKRDTKEHNKQKQQKYNLLKLIFLYLLTHHITNLLYRFKLMRNAL